MTKNNVSTVDEKEIQHFSRDSDKWWDEQGPFAPLHKMNPARIDFIKTQICKHFKRDTLSMKALDKLTLCDVGCGGGIICEPMARLGAKVTGIDADKIAIEAATSHAKTSSLKIDYQNKPIEELKKSYDIVLALEIIEHVSNPTAFIENCAARVKKGGLLIVSTLNRTPKSYALGIIAAEHILRWVPQGTHQWKKFMRPSEIANIARANHMHTKAITGVNYNPLKDKFFLNQDTGMNYIMVFEKN